jgi:type II secretory pathway pseudopilin PulG
MSSATDSLLRAVRCARRRLGGEHGFTVVELSVAMTIMIIVLGATLAPFEFFQRGARKNNEQNQAQDAARLAMARLVRDARNVAGQSQYIERATGSDLVFQTVDGSSSPGGTNNANIERVRYCLNTGTGVLWRQVQTWTTSSPPTLPSTTSCPDSAWPTQTKAASNIRNGSRAVFSYDSGTPTNVTSIDLTVYVDVDPTRSPPESELTSSAYLRNQNQAPVGSFTATPTGGGKVQLNGSGSYDPEGGALTYKWYDGSTFSGATQIGTGQNCTCTAGGTGTRTIWLQVTDPSGLVSTPVSQTVNVT